MINLFAMISLHTQLLIGLILYFMSDKVKFVEGWMKEASYRFYGMEHFLGMIVAIVLVTIGRKMAEKQSTDIDKHKKIRTFYTIALVIIIASIPWPFRTALGGAWF
jgi:ABC-type dipeptide/oligopeptide/nickel transport system permease subunit